MKNGKRIEKGYENNETDGENDKQACMKATARVRRKRTVRLFLYLEYS